jgi:hypothetical protein
MENMDILDKNAPNMLLGRRNITVSIDFEPANS